VDGAVLDLAGAARRHSSALLELLDRPTLNDVMAAGPPVWRELRAQVPTWAADTASDLRPLDSVALHLPFAIGDYVDFYASEHHATNLGRILRPGQPPLAPNWRHQPVGYHGRAGTVVVSGTPVVRPCGPRRDGDGVAVGPTQRLDVEAEVGFVVGMPSARTVPVPIEAFADHVFGVVLVNDWSARDIQAWETVPLGPFLGKSFQTSVSPWVVPLDALRAARVAPAAGASPVAGYLTEPEPWGLDIAIRLAVNGEVVSTPPYRAMHWSPAQMLAHLTVNGASVRTGDLYASGTVSGPSPDEVGSLFELWKGERFLADGDQVTISADAPAGDGTRLDLGEVSGVVRGPRLDATASN
jgi:fumarylacetoacetase